VLHASNAVVDPVLLSSDVSAPVSDPAVTRPGNEDLEVCVVSLSDLEAETV
jgi:hypothetical protein